MCDLRISKLHPSVFFFTPSADLTPQSHESSFRDQNVTACESEVTPVAQRRMWRGWWHPLDEQPGPNAVPNSPLAWTGDFKDGLGNRITMLAYANPPDIRDERQRGDGYGLARFGSGGTP
jgi:hypothetical protein